MRNADMKLTSLLLIIAFASFGLSGCNTTQGIGEDVEAAGEYVEETAEEVEDDLD